MDRLDAARGGNGRCASPGHLWLHTDHQGVGDLPITGICSFSRLYHPHTQTAVQLHGFQGQLSPAQPMGDTLLGGIDGSDNRALPDVGPHRSRPGEMI